MTTNLINTIQRIAARYPEAEDRAQDGLLAAQRILETQPDATDSFVAQGARFAIQHEFRRGRSVDTGTRIGTGIAFDTEAEDGIDLPSSQDVSAEAAVSDLTDTIRSRLSERAARVFEFLLAGESVTEIAARFNVKHPVISRYRRQIATIYAQLV